MDVSEARLLAFLEWKANLEASKEWQRILFPHWQIISDKAFPGPMYLHSPACDDNGESKDAFQIISLNLLL